MDRVEWEKWAYEVMGKAEGILEAASELGQLTEDEEDVLEEIRACREAGTDVMGTDVIGR